MNAAHRGAAAATSDVASASIEGPLGTMIASANAYGICRLAFVEAETLPRAGTATEPRAGTATDDAESLQANQHLRFLASELEDYFAGRLREFSVSLATNGSPFEERVWAELRGLAWGTTTSYRRLAETLGSPGASRAVGAANGSNPLPIVIPCHRVLRADGDLGGYSGGLWRKQRLLEIEGVCLPIGDR